MHVQLQQLQVFSAKMSRNQIEAPPTTTPAPTAAPPSNEPMDSETQTNANATGGKMPGSAASNGEMEMTLPPTIFHPTPHRIRFRTVNHFSIPVTTNLEPTVFESSTSFFRRPLFFAIPWKSSGMYINNMQMAHLWTKTMKWRPTAGSFKLGNFATHTGNIAGTGAAHIAMNYNGVMYESFMGSARDFGPCFLGKVTTTNSGRVATHFEVSADFSNTDRSIAVKQYPYEAFQVAQNGGKYIKLQNSGATRVNHHMVKFPSWNERTTLQMHAPAHTAYSFSFPEGNWFSKSEKDTPAVVENVPQFSSSQQNGFNGIVSNVNRGKHRMATGFTTVPSNQRKSHPRFQEGTTLTSNPCSYGHVTLVDQVFNPTVMGQTIQNNTGYYNSQHTVPTNCDLFCFRVVPPATLGGDPNIMVQFTIEADLEVEYYDMMCESMEKNVYVNYNADANVTENTTDTNFQMEVTGDVSNDALNYDAIVDRTIYQTFAARDLKTNALGQQFGAKSHSINNNNPFRHGAMEQTTAGAYNQFGAHQIFGEEFQYQILPGP